MEINAEINKIFGQEMAKLFAEQISEEELRQEAIKSYNNLRNKNYSSFYSSDSEFDRYLKSAVLDRFKDEVNKYLETEEVQIDIQTEARKLVDEIRETAKKKIIEKASNALVSVYSGHEVSMAIAEMSNALRRN